MDKPASKYCFRATCRVYIHRNTVAQRHIGSFTGYHASPKISERVMNTCLLELAEKFPEGAECDSDVELVFLEHCPVELDNDVTFSSEVNDITE